MSHAPQFVMTSGKERGPSDHVIVSCAIGPEYQELLYSTRLHCEKYIPEAWCLLFRDYPPGCPPHDERPYAFKIWALRQAICCAFRYVVWMDATFQPVGSFQPLWHELSLHGWYCPPQGSSNLATWSSDDFVKLTGTTREYLRQVPLVYSGLVAFDMHHPMARRIWEGWWTLESRDAFMGCHKNVPFERPRRWGLKWQGHVSSDPLVEGHRHDETALSWVLHTLGQVPRNLGFLTMESPNGFIDHHVRLIIPPRGVS